ncbi:MAG: D-alanyl-D-alanine carboxypeptidase, partial [Ignavibacteriales bacterium]|nr:D-alanyl-D-alanine carboxypeptidase [Ignavibacteriales bacterium]
VLRSVTRIAKVKQTTTNGIDTALNGVSNLSGYVTAKNGHLLAFSIMVQNFVEEYSKARKFQDKICELLAEYRLTDEELFAYKIFCQPL